MMWQCGFPAVKKIADPSLTALGEKIRDLWLERAVEAQGVLDDATKMLGAAGLGDIRFSENAPYWHAVGTVAAR